jgi:hypothetical protein
MADTILHNKLVAFIQKVARKAKTNASWSNKIPPQIRHRVEGDKGIIDVPIIGGFAYAAEYGTRHPSGWDVHRHPHDRSEWTWGPFSHINPQGRPFLRPAVLEETHNFEEAMGDVLTDWARKNGFN